MERVVVGGLLVVGSVIGAGWSWRAFLARHVAVGMRDRVLTRGALGGGLVCLAAGELGLFLAVEGATGAGGDRLVPRVVRVVVAVGIAAVVYGVVAWREWRRDRPARTPAPVSAPAPQTVVEPPADYVPPTPQAAALLAARKAGDPSAVCDALAQQWVFWLVDDAEVDAVLAGTLDSAPACGHPGADGVLQLPVFTEGCLPAAPPGRSYFGQDFAWYAAVDRPVRLVVDEGTPHAVRLDTADIRAWTAARGGRPDAEPRQRLRSIAPVGPPDAFTRGLACAAWHAVMNDYPWNRFGPRGHDRLGARRLLRAGWGIESARDWQQMLDRLADPEPFNGDLLFGLRRSLGEGRFVPAEEITEVVERNVEHNGRELSDAVLAELRQVEAYEGYLREHGVLAEWEQVHSQLAWDIGRGAMLARYGFDAGFCDESTGRWQVERFGLLAGRCYGSWPEFGAALVLGRALWTARQDDDLGLRGMDLAATVRPFTILTSEPASPWRTVPFLPAARVATVDDAEA